MGFMRLLTSMEVTLCIEYCVMVGLDALLFDKVEWFQSQVVFALRKVCSGSGTERRQQQMCQLSTVEACRQPCDHI